MNPVAFNVFGIPIMWYGILIASGVLIGTMLAIRECRRIGFREDNLIDLLIFVIPSAIIGARLYYVIFSWDHYKGNLKEIINIRNGGLAIHGAIFAAIIAALIFCKIKKIKFWQFADIIAPSLSLGQAIGRWGNFINQEAYGVVTDLPWGIVVNGQKVHPTFLYESLIDLSIFIFLVIYRRKSKKFDGELILLYFIFYSAGRFLIEGLRTDSLMIGNFRIAQLVSIGMIIFGIVLYCIKRKKN